MVRVSALERGHVRGSARGLAEHVRERVADLGRVAPQLLVAFPEREEPLHAAPRTSHASRASRSRAAPQRARRVARDVQGYAVGRVHNDRVVRGEDGRAAQHFVVGVRRDHRDAVIPTRRSRRARSAVEARGEAHAEIGDVLLEFGDARAASGAVLGVDEEGTDQVVDDPLEVGVG